LQFRTDEINKSSKIITKQLTDAQQTPLAEDKDNVKVPKVKNIL
jgi:NADH:ubiquinone oxidoreductase subunit D